MFTGGCLAVFTGHKDLVTSLQFSIALTTAGEGGRPLDAVASVSDDGTVKVFLFDTQQLILA